MKVEYRIGDCIEVLKEFPDNHFDSCVTDSPYGLAFMGRKWDTVEVYPFTLEWAKEVLRVLKPGAWLLSFGGTRTYHRMTCALEDVGFEVRDCMIWIYGSGFPKSYDISKGIDKKLGAERVIIGSRRADDIRGGNFKNFESKTVQYDYTLPATPEAHKWQGWGTALKPAWEPIVVCRKPLIGTVVDNVLKHGTGGINVDGCRIETETARPLREHTGRSGKLYSSGLEGSRAIGETNAGRWPSNLLLDEDSAKLVDEQSGVVDKPNRGIRGRGSAIYANGKGYANTLAQVGQEVGYEDIGGASRFFYTAKASRSEREKGLSAELECILCKKDPNHKGDHMYNDHPTVKPLDLMQYLVRLVTPKGGICLDPFLGSGTTMLACRMEGVGGLGIEKNEEYEPIIKGRLSYIPPALDTFDMGDD